MLFRSTSHVRLSPAQSMILAGAFLLGPRPAKGASRLGRRRAHRGSVRSLGLDHDLTQPLTLRDPRSIVLVQTGVAGTINLALALVIGQRFPEVSIIAATLLLGAVSCGLSVYLGQALALRAIGAAREAAVFAVRAVRAAVLAPFLLPESFALNDIVAGTLMVVGVFLLIRERHDHTHAHEPLDHDHGHTHDAHHQHRHDDPVAAGTTDATLLITRHARPRPRSR